MGGGSMVPGTRVLLTLVVAVFAGCATAPPSAYIPEEANIVFHARAEALRLGLDLVERVADEAGSLPGDPDVVRRMGTFLELIDALHGFVAYSLDDLGGEADVPVGLLLVPREGGPAQLEADIRGLLDDTDTIMATVPEGLLVANGDGALKAMLRAGAGAPPPPRAPEGTAFLRDATASGYVIVPEAISVPPIEFAFELDSIAFSYRQRTFRQVMRFGDEAYARGMAQIVTGLMAVSPNLTARVGGMLPDDLPPEVFAGAMELAELVEYRVSSRGGDLIATSRVAPDYLDRWLAIIGEMAALQDLLGGPQSPVSQPL